MESKFIMKTDSVEANTPIKIFERTENGLLLGEYVGYYNYKHRSFTLYPKHNPFAANNGKLQKQEISAKLVRYE